MIEMKEEEDQTGTEGRGSHRRALERNDETSLNGNVTMLYDRVAHTHMRNIMSRKRNSRLAKIGKF